MNRAMFGVLLVIVGLALLLALLAFAGCGTAQEQVMQPATEGADTTVYTVTRAELENPENRTVYVCPMVEHKDQVSLDPDARCSLCGMAVIPLEEAEKNWAKDGD